MSFNFPQEDKKEKPENRQHNNNNNNGNNRVESTAKKMDSVFKKEFRVDPQTEAMLESPFVVIIFLAALGLVYVGAHFLAEDMFTTMVGWNALPIKMAYDNTGWFVALGLVVLPPVGYALKLLTGNRLWMYAAITAILLDSVLDIAFRMSDVYATGSAWWFALSLSVMVSLVVFTLLSEVAFTFGVPLVFFLLPYAIKQVAETATKILRLFVELERKLQEWL